MKNKKIFILPFLLLSIFFAFSNESHLEYKILPTCDPNIFSNCEVIQKNIYNYSTHSALDSPQTISISYSSNEIKCHDKEDVNLAYYDENESKRVNLDSTISETKKDNYQISAETSYLGYIAIISNDCVIANCNFGAYGLRPFSGLVGINKEITFSFCGFVPKCNANKDGLCDVNCFQGIDPDCGTCSPEASDCCLPSNDGICDIDCYEGVDIDC